MAAPAPVAPLEEASDGEEAPSEDDVPEERAAPPEVAPRPRRHSRGRSEGRPKEPSLPPRLPSLDALVADPAFTCRTEWQRKLLPPLDPATERPMQLSHSVDAHARHRSARRTPLARLPPQPPGRKRGGPRRSPRPEHAAATGASDLWPYSGLRADPLATQPGVQPPVPPQGHTTPGFAQALPPQQPKGASSRPAPFIGRRTVRSSGRTAGTLPPVVAATTAGDGPSPRQPLPPVRQPSEEPASARRPSPRETWADFTPERLRPPDLMRVYLPSSSRATWVLTQR